MNRFLRRLGWVMQRRRKEAELRAELDFHLAEEADDRRALGLTEEQARVAARRDLGNVTLVVEDTRAVWGWILFEQLGQDLRYAVRTLSRTPSVTLAATITLALGIGLTTAIFSVVNGILLRPLPFHEPDRLLVLDTLIPGGQSDGGLSPPNFMSLYEEETHAFPSIAAVMTGELTLTGAGDARRVASASVSAELFEVLQVNPVLGRAFHREENESGQERVVVLGHALWQQQFGGDAGVIGRTVVLNGAAHSVIGVMAAGVDYPGESALWVPLRYGGYFSAASTAGRKNNAYVRVLGRLRSGVSLEAARAELAALGRRLEDRFPETNAGVRFTARPLHEELVGDVRTPLLLLLGAVGFVLLIAGANVAGLLLARATARRDEIAVRGALGAGRARIVRQLVTESLLLGLGGGALGLLLAFWVSGRIVAAQIEGLRRLGLVDAIRVDGTVLAFALGVTVIAGVLAGLLPAFRAADAGLAGALQSAGRSGLASHRGGRLRSTLVIGQLALAVVLLHGAGLLLHSFIRLTSVDPGFRMDKVLSFRLDLPGAEYNSKERVRAFFSGLLEGISQQPGVQSVGAISRLPIGVPGSFRSRFRLDEGARAGEEEPSIGVRVVSPEYFQTLNVPLLRGRGLTDRDRVGSVPVVVINEAAVAQFFPGADPIGRRLLHFSYDPVETAADAFTIVGVVANVRSRGLREEPPPEAYFAHAQVPLDPMFVVVRTAGDPLAQIGAIRTEIRALDRNLPIIAPRTLDQVVTDSLDRPRLFTTLVTLFSAVALTLAAVGIFGLLSFAVARRTHEIGVRIALGASPSTLVRSIVREALGLVVMGLGIGLGGALALTRLLESQLFDVTPTDPVAFAGVTFTLGVTALGATLVPAWRAATVDPLVALRIE